jgi:2-phosphoglycerate kinase
VLVIGFVSILFGYLPAGFGFYGDSLGYAKGLLVSSIILIGVIMGLGRNVEQEVEEEQWEEKMGIVKMEDIDVVL